MGRQNRAYDYVQSCLHIRISHLRKASQIFNIFSGQSELGPNKSQYDTQLTGMIRKIHT